MILNECSLKQGFAAPKRSALALDHLLRARRRSFLRAVSRVRARSPRTRCPRERSLIIFDSTPVIEVRASPCLPPASRVSRALRPAASLAWLLGDMLATLHASCDLILLRLETRGRGRPRRQRRVRPPSARSALDLQRGRPRRVPARASNRPRFGGRTRRLARAARRHTFVRHQRRSRRPPARNEA
jgi:hypothetical protein